MGKVRTRVLGLEDVEEAQKKKQKVKAVEKKSHFAKAPRDEAEKSIGVSADKKADKEAKVALEEAQTAQTKETQAPQKAEKAKKETKKVPSAKRRSQAYTLNKRLVEKTKKYPVSEAVAALKKMKPARFDESIELHLNVDKAGLKGEVTLPHATGKAVRVRIVDDATLGEIAAGKIEFDILVTHPSFMPKIAPLAKILGPRGLMPSPKSGTISDKPEELAKRFTSGALKWKTEAKAPIIHQMVGKKSSPDKALSENIQSFTAAVGQNHIVSAYVSATMTPSVQLEIV